MNKKQWDGAFLIYRDFVRTKRLSMTETVFITHVRRFVLYLYLVFVFTSCCMHFRGPDVAENERPGCGAVHANVQPVASHSNPLRVILMIMIL